MNLTMSDRHGVEIDYCPQCRGVWLDRGELDKIIERAAALDNHREGSPRSEPRYDAPKRRHDSGEYQRYGEDEYEYKKHKRKSFLGDLFDF
jgi:Zn-finger nucleic acid-binding protein